MHQTVSLFGGYSILQQDGCFKLGQDSMLLSAFARIRKGELGLDLGCGIGCIGLLMLLRYAKGRVDGLELDPQAAALAAENYENCGLSGRGSIVEADFRSLPPHMAQAYDFCVCNPPYYSPKEGKTAQAASVAAARTQLNGDIFDVCAAACRAIKTGGRFYICYKPDGLNQLFLALAGHGLAAKRLRFVHHAPDKKANLILLEARKGASCRLEAEPPLFVTGADGVQTAEYRSILEGGSPAAKR